MGGCARGVSAERLETPLAGGAAASMCASAFCRHTACQRRGGNPPAPAFPRRGKRERGSSDVLDAAGISSLNGAVSEILLCFECGFEDFGRGRTAGIETVWEGFGERMGRWRKRERRLVLVNGDLRHTSGGTALRRRPVGIEMASAQSVMRCPVLELGGEPRAERG